MGYDPLAEYKAWLIYENNGLIQASHIFNYWDSLIPKDNIEEN